MCVLVFSSVFFLHIQCVKCLCCLTQVVSLGFGVLVDVFLCEAAEEDAVETRVEPVQMSPTHVTYT